MKEANTFTDLIAEYIDGTPSAEQLEQFVSLLKSSAENRKEFREAMRLHALLHELIVEDSVFMGHSDSGNAENLTFTPKRKSRTIHIWWIRVAAALILVATIWMYMAKEKVKPDYMDLTWLNSVPQSAIQNYPEDVVSIINANGEKVSIDFKKPKLVTGGKGSTGGMGSTGKGSSGKGSQPNVKSGLYASERLDAAIQNFINSSDFKYAIPKTLPGEWKLINIHHLSTSRVQLIYRQPNVLLNVFLWSDSGKELKTSTYKINGKNRKFTIFRKGGLVIAFEALKGETQDWNKLVDKFLITDKTTDEKKRS